MIPTTEVVTESPSIIESTPEVTPATEITQVEQTKLATQKDFEEQRGIAFQIVFLFIGLTALLFGLLFVYHKVQQTQIPLQREQIQK